MNVERDKAIKLLESKIERIVRNIINEKNGELAASTNNLIKAKNDQKSRRGEDSVEKSDSFKRQYKTIQTELGRPEMDATQLMARALGFDPKDDSARSHAFKKLHREKTPDGTGNYEFNAAEVGKIANALQSV